MHALPRSAACSTLHGRCTMLIATQTPACGVLACVSCSACRYWRHAASLSSPPAHPWLRRRTALQGARVRSGRASGGAAGLILMQGPGHYGHGTRRKRTACGSAPRRASSASCLRLGRRLRRRPGPRPCGACLPAPQHAVPWQHHATRAWAAPAGCLQAQELAHATRRSNEGATTSTR